MKKTAWYCGALVLAVLNAVYLALTADSFYLEYVKDEFVYWGYPQWGWMYSCLLYTSPSPRDGLLSRLPSYA